MPDEESDLLPLSVKVRRLISLTELYSQDFRARSWSDQRREDYRKFKRAILRMWIFIKQMGLPDIDPLHAAMKKAVKTLLTVEKMIAGEIEPAPKPVYAMVQVARNAKQAVDLEKLMHVPDNASWIRC